MRGLLQSNRVKLTSINEGDLKNIEEWFNDVEFLRHYDMVPAVPQTSRDLKVLLEIYGSSERYIFAVRLKESGDIIGIAGFDEILWSNGVATVFIGIGEKKYQRQGFGKEAMELLLDFGFNELNFYRIQLNVIAYNEKAIKLYESLGFEKEGTFREFIYRDGKRFDMYLYGKLNKK